MKKWKKLYDQKRTGKIFSIYHMIHIGLIGAICEKGKYASEQTLGKIQNVINNFKTDFPTFPIDFLKLNAREKLKKLIYKKTRPNSRAPIPDKSSSSIDINVQLSSPEVIKEKSASIPSKQLLKHLQM
ncbi:hypothetical protein GLOIN_2v1789680 [Rhizophagus irregularis DAOM 181602=DAOM 197198]|nr:hypothetical protein GLOIN_2v1789680 [Rhizophagus irregularis DAOM 181602=DAOM 197198]